MPTFHSPLNHPATPPDSAVASHLALVEMKLIPPILAMLFVTVTCSSSGAEDARKSSDEEQLSDLMAGEYDLIGRKPDSTTTYSGRVTLRAEGAALVITRTVNGKTQKVGGIFSSVRLLKS